MRCRKSDPACCRIHVFRKFRNGTRSTLGQNVSHVIGGIDKQGLQRKIDCHRLSGTDADFAGLLRIRQDRDGNLLIKPQFSVHDLVENHICRHQFGKGRRIPRLACTFLCQHFTGFGVNQNIGRSNFDLLERLLFQLVGGFRLFGSSLFCLFATVLAILRECMGCRNCNRQQHQQETASSEKHHWNSPGLAQLHLTGPFSPRSDHMTTEVRS